MKAFSAIALSALLLTGCGEANRDAADENNPRIRKGLEQVELKQWNEAVAYFQEALKNDYRLARADLELALIYHQQKKDYVRAIHHYRRYLEKRPGTEKEAILRDWIRQAEISFAAQIGESAGDISEEIVRLTRENNLLRKQLSRMAVVSPTAAKRPEPAATEKPEPVSPDPTPVSEQPVERIQLPAPVPETYQVLPGDTLTRIAKTVYGDSGLWRKIYEANLNQMKNESDLKAGQTILIPKLGN